jgi:hypothetical protein
MILSDYYRLEILPENAGKKSMRYDTTASTGRYTKFEEMAQKSRVNRFFVNYVKIPDTFSSRAASKAERAFTKSSCNISSVFIPNVNYPQVGYGDIKGSTDAVVFVFSADYKQVEFFIARGYKFKQKALYSLFVTRQLDYEIKQLREAAKPVLTV